LFAIDQPTFEIEQKNLNFVQKKCTNYAREIPIDA
jgi:hypothetical protein